MRLLAKARVSDWHVRRAHTYVNNGSYLPATPMSVVSSSFAGIMLVLKSATKERENETAKETRGSTGYAVHSRGAFRIAIRTCVRARVHDGHGETQKQCDCAATSTRFAELRDRPRATQKRTRAHIRAQWHTLEETRMRPSAENAPNRTAVFPERNAKRRAGGKRTRWISASLAKQDIAHKSAATYARGAWLIGLFRRYSETLASTRERSALAVRDTIEIVRRMDGSRASLMRPCRALLEISWLEWKKLMQMSWNNKY